MSDIQSEAAKEMKRMAEIFAEIKVLNKPHAQEFYDFAKNYFKDGKHFYDFEKYVQAFEAFIIAWAYLDIGLKLKLFETKLTKHFTA
ncbi:MAG: DUF357 domain-containing protein [Candidatus Nanoarchaeia archaeon]|nr:DUF357 domain-containing protein [Candidatus Nanoarchaeia archaeon]MDD5239250.1 DUF357 domain-containing protein [Candidatus Nanoarchaeia archaeon]